MSSWKDIQKGNQMERAYKLEFAGERAGSLYVS